MFDKDSLLIYLKDNGIHATTCDHEPVFTVEESQKLTGHLPGAHVKNLFLVDKKGDPWLVTCGENQTVKVNGLSRLLGAPRFSFAKSEVLFDRLGVQPGSVTPLGLINDAECLVTFVIDKHLLEADLINVHPLVNSATTSITPADLTRFVELRGHKMIVVDLEETLTA